MTRNPYLTNCTQHDENSLLIAMATRPLTCEMHKPD